MKTFLSLIHVVVSVVMIVVILLQHRKQGGFGGVFGGGTQADSGQWQRFTGLTKLTIVLAGIFMAMSLVLALMS